MKLNDLDGYNPRVLTLQNKWRTVWRMSIDRKKALQDALDTLQEVRMYCLFIPVQMPLPEFILWNTLNIFSIFQLEGLKTFDFEVWKTKYLNWIKAKKLRITDFFRRQDKDGDGFLSREEFVNGMLHTRKCQKIDGKTRTRLHWPVMHVSFSINRILSLVSDFPTNKTELHAVFDMFATTNRHFIEYKDFIEAMKPVRHVGSELNMHWKK